MSNYRSETIINGNKVLFMGTSYQPISPVASITFEINGKMNRTLKGDKVHPAICRWIIKEFQKVCKWADEKQLILYCTALTGDRDEELRRKAYHKYLGSVISTGFYVRGLNGSAITAEEWYKLQPSAEEPGCTDFTEEEILEFTAPAPAPAPVPEEVYDLSEYIADYSSMTIQELSSLSRKVTAALTEASNNLPLYSKLSAISIEIREASANYWRNRARSRVTV